MKIGLTVKPHVPFLGIDDGWYVNCTKTGLTHVVKRDYGWFCGGCERRLEIAK